MRNTRLFLLVLSLAVCTPLAEAAQAPATGLVEGATCPAYASPAGVGVTGNRSPLRRQTGGIGGVGPGSGSGSGSGG